MIEQLSFFSYFIWDEGLADVLNKKRTANSENELAVQEIYEKF
ncbi:hypothetical protein [Streptococcus ovis]|nr:hypothetical protein [Streptococcus ovis]